MDMSQKLLELVKELEAANQELRAAKEVERQASSEETAALNRVNKVQKAIDEEIASIKNAAEWNTDWHSTRNRVLRSAAH
jgi:sensor domain CHASE-containing protein